MGSPTPNEHPNTQWAPQRAPQHPVGTQWSTGTFGRSMGTQQALQHPRGTQWSMDTHGQLTCTQQVLLDLVGT